MSGCKHSIWKILSAGAALALLLPRLALGEFGVCPPYSKTFGPDDLPEEILAFIEYINQRPGGGTVVLEPGRYELDIAAPIQFWGVVCFRASSPDEPTQVWVSPGGRRQFGRVEAEGILTVQSVDLVGYGDDSITVAVGGTLFAENAGVVCHNHGLAILENADSRSNTGTLVMRGGSLGSLTNEGLAFVEQVEAGVDPYCDDLNCYGGEALVNRNGGALTFSESTLQGGCNRAKLDEEDVCTGGLTNEAGSTVYFYSSSQSDGRALVNEGVLEVMDSKVESCEGSITDLGHNEFYAGGGCIVTDPTSTYYNGAVEAVVRAVPYWRTVGRVDVSEDNALFIAVMSGGSFDPTTIAFDTFEIEDFPRSALRGIGYGDKNGDGLSDYNVWYRLDRALWLDCGYYDQAFSAMTTEGLTLNGRLKFEAVGCTQ